MDDCQTVKFTPEDMEKNKQIREVLIKYKIQFKIKNK